MKIRPLAAPTFAFVLIAGWIVRDFIVALFRTFILGHSCEQQMADQRPDLHDN